MAQNSTMAAIFNWNLKTNFHFRKEIGWKENQTKVRAIVFQGMKNPFKQAVLIK